MVRIKNIIADEIFCPIRKTGSDQDAYHFNNDIVFLLSCLTFRLRPTNTPNV